MDDIDRIISEAPSVGWVVNRPDGDAFLYRSEPHAKDEADYWGTKPDTLYTAATVRQLLLAAVEGEREACAKEALTHVTHPEDPSNEVWQCAYNHVAEEIAAAIRSRKDRADTDGGKEQG